MTDEPLSRPEQKFLYEFRNGSRIDWITQKDHYKYIEYSQVYKMDLPKVFQKLLDEYYLRPAEPEEIVAFDFSLNELKEECALRGLKTSGRKIDLARLLIQNNPNFDVHRKNRGDIYYPTFNGLEVIDEYQFHQKQLKSHEYERVTEFLSKINNGSIALNEDMQDTTFTDETGYSIHLDRQTLSYLRILYSGNIPGFLFGLGPNFMDIIRESLGVSRILGANEVSKYANIDTNIPGLKLGKAMSVMMNYCHSKIDLKYYRDDKYIKRITIIGNEKSVCPSCRELLNKNWPVNGTVPEIPNPNCQNRMDPCLLHYQPFFPEQVSETHTIYIEAVPKKKKRKWWQTCLTILLVAIILLIVLILITPSPQK